MNAEDPTHKDRLLPAIGRTRDVCFFLDGWSHHEIPPLHNNTSWTC